MSVLSISDDMSFDVSWFAVRSYAMDRTPVFLASLDRKGIAVQARRNGSSDVSLARIAPLEFQFRIHGCEDQDFGNHYCVVTPWVRSATGVWQQEAEVRSKPIFVAVKMDGKDSSIFGCILTKSRNPHLKIIKTLISLNTLF